MTWPPESFGLQLRLQRKGVAASHEVMNSDCLPIGESGRVLMLSVPAYSQHAHSILTAYSQHACHHTGTLAAHVSPDLSQTLQSCIWKAAELTRHGSPSHCIRPSMSQRGAQCCSVWVQNFS